MEEWKLIFIKEIIGVVLGFWGAFAAEYIC